MIGNPIFDSQILYEDSLTARNNEITIYDIIDLVIIFLIIQN